MLNGKAAIVLLIVGLKKRQITSKVNISQNQNLYEEEQKLNWICLAMQQKQI